MGEAEAVAAADVLPPGRLIVFNSSLASAYLLAAASFLPVMISPMLTFFGFDSV